MSTPRVYSSSGITSRGPTLDDADFSLTAAAREPDLISSGGSSGSVVDDRNMLTHTGATYDSGWDAVAMDIVPGTIGFDSEFVSLDPSVATVDATGKVSRVSNGTARIQMRTPLLTRQLSLAVARTVSSTTQFDSYVTDSLDKHCSDAVDSRISGLTPSVAKPIFTTKNHDAATYVRNTGCWLNGVDLTAIAAWKTYWVGKLGGVAISPRHILFCQHQALNDQGVVRFVTAGGVVVERTCTAQAYAGNSSDFRVGLLNSDLPGTITPVEVLPVDALNYLPSWGQGYRVPIVITDQDANALVVDSYMSAGSPNSGFNFQAPTDAARLGFYKLPISGDSGSPVFFVINGHLVLATVVSGPAFGASILDNIMGINAAMTTLGGGYQLTEADLSGFTDYS